LTDKSFFGHPRGLFYLAFTEAWERFSFYGMTALLMLFMVNHLLLPTNATHIAGYDSFRATIESITGPLSTQALASRIFGLYGGLVYFTPVLGGIIADRWLGHRNAVIVGAVLMTLGHLAMALEQTFLLALSCLVIGSGFLKGNITTQVGALYPADDIIRRSKGYTIFSASINVGAFTGSFFCGLAAKYYGWHVAFTLAGVFMLCGLATYLSGYKHLPARVKSINQSASALTDKDRTTLLLLFGVLAISIFHTICYFQSLNIFPLWLQQHVALNVGGFTIPIPWFLSTETLSSITAAPLLLMLWRWQAKRGNEPTDFNKFTIAATMAACSYLLLAAVSFLHGDAPVHPIWPLLFTILIGYSFVYNWPTVLSLVSRSAPASVNSTMMGIAFLTLFISSNFIGWVAGFYEKMTPTAFWLLHAGFGFTGAIIVLTIGPTINRRLRQHEPR
jgi:POT family proton-dependent oligopeptide transporter